jgi:hypothetical protein
VCTWCVSLPSLTSFPSFTFISHLACCRPLPVHSQSLMAMCKHHKKSFIKKVLLNTNRFVREGLAGKAAAYYQSTYPYFTQRT